MSQEPIPNPEEYVRALGRRVDHLADRVDDLEAENERLRSMLDEHGRKDQLKRRLDDLEQQVDIVDASVPSQHTTRVQNVIAVLDYAFENGTGGTAGVTVNTGEVTAAIDGSRDTALRLMDDIGGGFQWAETETPGGPKPKQLRIATKRHDRDDLVDDVTTHYAGGDESA